MNIFYHARLYARFVLVWFALSIGVAIASPVVHPQSLEFICSGSGVMKFITQSDGGKTEVSAQSMDCPLCVNLAAGPPLAAPSGAMPVHPAYVLQQLVAVRRTSFAVAPWQARAPPPSL